MSSRERMTTVLGCLVLSVTAGAIVLRLLQPAPLEDVTAFSLSAAFNPIQQIYQTRVPVDGSTWGQIVIHQSGSQAGNAQSLAQSSSQSRSDGLVYHFVINNGRGAPDGRIQVSQRWVDQRDDQGRPVSHTGDFRNSAIRICLIGDFRQTGPGRTQMAQLQALIRSLQQRCRIPAEDISLASRASAGPEQWQRLPLDELRQALLTDSHH